MPIERYYGGFSPALASFEVAGFDTIYCDSGADICLISVDRIPDDHPWETTYTRVYDLTGNYVSSDMSVIISIEFNRHTNSFEMVNEGGIPIEFVVLDPFWLDGSGMERFPTIIGANAMAALNVNLSFASHGYEHSQLNSTDGGWVTLRY